MRTTRLLRAPWLWATTLLAACLFVGGLSGEAGAQQRRQPPPLPDNVAVRDVSIWSEGTRMAGDFYYPKDMKEDAKLPTVVMSHGWGGTKAACRPVASRIAAAGYIVLAFDYRGWGESESRLVVKGEMPKPDENGEATVKAQFIRTVVDPHDQVWDIRHAIDFIQAEPNVDTARVGYWGSSYSGGHAVWVAANEPRVKCAVGQVAAANSVSLLETAFQDKTIVEQARTQAIQRARGEIAPVPQGTHKVPNLRGWAIMDRVADYNPVDDAGRITIPLLIIDAEKEELFDRHIAGELAVKRAKANGAPAKYHVVPDITHYGMYRQAFEEATKLAIEWFDEHLKSAD